VGPRHRSKREKVRVLRRRALLQLHQRRRRVLQQLRMVHFKLQLQSALELASGPGRVTKTGTGCKLMQQCWRHLGLAPPPR
jgi:hypothetical protein